MKQAVNIQVFSLAELSPHADGMFRELTKQPAAESVRFPRVRVAATADSFVVLAGVPGIRRELIDVSVMSDRLILRGKRSLAATGPSPSTAILHDELHEGEFERIVKFPGVILPGSATWTVEDGLLRFEVQRLPESDVSRISEE